MREYVDENNKHLDGGAGSCADIGVDVDRSRLDDPNSDIYKAEAFIMSASKPTPSEISKSLGLSDDETRGIIDILADSGRIDIVRGKDEVSIWYVEYKGVARSKREESLLDRYEATQGELDRLRAERDSLRQQLAAALRENSQLLKRLDEAENQELHLNKRVGAAALNLFVGSSEE